MLEIFQFNFMVRAFAAGAIVGVIAPLIGTFLVIRRFSRLADTLAHVSLAGVISKNHQEEALGLRNSRAGQGNCIMVHAKPIRFLSA